MTEQREFSVGERVLALYRKDWYFGVITKIVEAKKQKSTALPQKIHTVHYDDDQIKERYAGDLRHLPVVDEFAVNKEITAMWCGMGHCDGKNKAARLKVDSPGYWANGTVVGAVKDSRGNTLYHCKFLDKELKWETEIYNLYGEYIIDRVD